VTPLLAIRQEKCRLARGSGVPLIFLSRWLSGSLYHFTP